jgi:hypothetical protein
LLSQHSLCGGAELLLDIYLLDSLHQNLQGTIPPSGELAEVFFSR